jgi:hypothetical protein
MEQAKAIAASWGRSYLAAALAVYMAGGDFKAMAMGGVAAERAPKMSFCAGSTQLIMRLAHRGNDTK